MTKPLVLCPMQTENPDSSIYSIKKRYLRSLRRAGANVVLVPPCHDRSDIADFIAIADGIMIPGGGDVNPALYHENITSALCEPAPERDVLESSLIAFAAERDIPLFGICRGLQITNAVMGGSLCQEVSSLQNANNHWQEAPYNLPSHCVSIRSDNLLARIVDGTTQNAVLPVNSMHNQGIERLGDCLTVCATADDGLIEAISWEEKNFFLCVQWHPEYMIEDKASLRLFEQFVEACKQFASHKLQ